MKNTNYRIVSLFLSMVILITACISPAVVNAATLDENIYYVMSGGTGNGKTELTPAATVKDVIATIAGDGLGAGNTATIYILQRTDWNEYNGEAVGKINNLPTPQPHNMTAWSADGSAMTDHAFNIVVKSPEGQNNYLAYSQYLGENNKLTLGGNIVFDNVTLVAMRNELDQPLIMKGYNVHFTENFVFGYVNCSKHDNPAKVWDGTVKTTAPSFRTEMSDNIGNYTVPNAMTVTLDAKYDSSTGTKSTNRKFFIGTSLSGGYSVQFKEDVNIVINNKDSYVPFQWGNTKNNQYSKVIFKKNLNLNIKAAKEIVNTAGESTFKVEGGLQIIADSDTTITGLEDTLTAKGITSYWYLVNEADADVISFTETAGTFNLKYGYDIIAIDEKGNSIPSTDGQLVLPAGKYTIKDISTPKMLHITANEAGPIQQRVTVIPGETYTYSFSLSNTISEKDITVGAYHINHRATSIAKGVKKSAISNDRYTVYTYEITMPETMTTSSGDPTDETFVGVKFTNTSHEGYLFNASLYKTADKQKTEMLINGNFISGYLDKWTWGWTDFRSGDRLGLSEFADTDGKFALKVILFDESVMPDMTPKMLHINSQNAGPIGQLIPVTAGETYTFKFEISNNAKFDVVVNDNNKRHIQLPAQASCVSREDKGRYSAYEYQVKMPYDLENDYVFIGLRFKGTAPYDSYLMNVSAYKTSDTKKTELLTNGNFMCGYLDDWVFKYTNFTSGDKLGLSSCTFKEDNKEITLEVLKFNESLMAEMAPSMPVYGDYMLYVNSQSRGPLGQAVAVTAGESYTFKFEISDNSKFAVTARDNNERKNAIPAKIECVNQEDKGKYSAYEYKITIPNNFMGDYAFIGIKFTGVANHECYFTNASVYKTSDANKQEMFKNGGFKNGYLDGWTWYNNGFTSSNNLCLTETTFKTEKQSVSLSVLPFDESKMPGEKQMMLLDDARTTTNELFVLETQTLKANVEYTLSFDYKFESGSLNKTLYYYVCGGVNDPGTLQTVSKTFYCTRKESGNLFTTISNNGRNFVATFTLTQEQVDSVNHFYAGFKFLTLNTKTKLYFANMTLYETADANKTNLFLNNEYSTKVNNWYSHWGRSTQGYDVFGRSDSEFTARYLPYDASLFESPADIHYGDTELDGDIDILDLVKADAIVSGTDYDVNVDVNNDGMLTAHDISDIKMHMIGTQPIEWVEKGHGLMEGANLSGGADEEAEELRNQILSAKDTLKQGTGWLNKTVYVAEDGDDSLFNGGTSQSRPISVNKLSSITLRSGDLVLFKRGDTFRFTEEIQPVDGVGYGAYGDGAKPVISGSLKDYADESLWTTDDNKMWKVNLGTSEASQVVFNGGQWVGFMKESLEEVISNGDFYYDKTEKVLYLYLNQINPAKYFDSIEIATTMRAFNKHGSNATKNNKFENLCFKYFTFGAMNLAFTDNVQITNCEMGWLGGRITDGGSKLGNAIQLWRHSNNTTISNNYIYQVFDAAITFQGSVDNDYTNLTFSKNLIEYCSMNFEFWGNDKDETTDTSDDIYTTMHNIAFEENIMRFAGYGFGGMQRLTQENQAFVLCWNNDYNEDQIKDFNIKNNIFDIANCNYYYGTPTLKDVDVSSNTYYQSSGSNLPVIKGQKYYCDDITSFETAIKEVDSNPTKIAWVN